MGIFFARILLKIDVDKYMHRSYNKIWPWSDMQKVKNYGILLLA